MFFSYKRKIIEVKLNSSSSGSDKIKFLLGTATILLFFLILKTSNRYNSRATSNKMMPTVYIDVKFSSSSIGSDKIKILYGTAKKLLFF